MDKINYSYEPEPLSWSGTNNVNLLQPDPATLHIRDMARSLSRRPRYGGFSDAKVSVGHHLLLCGMLYVEGCEGDGKSEEWDYAVESPAGLISYVRSGCLSPQQLRELATVLMHDAPEAYLSDIQRPLKRTDAFTGYREIEVTFERAISRRYELIDFASKEYADLVKPIDNRALACEVDICMPAVKSIWGRLPDPTPVGLRAIGRLTRDSDAQVEYMYRLLMFEVQHARGKWYTL